MVSAFLCFMNNQGFLGVDSSPYKFKSRLNIKQKKKADTPFFKAQEGCLHCKLRQMAQRDIERDKPLAMHEMFFNKDANRLDHLHGFISHEPSHISRPKLKLWGRINCLSMNDTLEATQILGSRLQNKHLHFSLILASKSGRNSLIFVEKIELQ